MPDMPTDKIIVKLDTDKLRELFGAGWLAPGDSLSVSSAKLTLDEVNKDVAILSIDEIEFAPSPKADPEDADAEVGPGEESTDAEEESAAMAMMSERDEK